MGTMNCGFCGSSTSALLLRSGSHRLVKCASCGLVYTDSYGAGATSYAEDDYFTRKNQYVSRWNEFCDIFEPLLDKVVRFKREGKLLDVGAGVGTLLSVAARRGFIVQGVEVSEWAAAFARKEKGLDVLTGPLENACLETESFDIVTINHVLEHVQDPLALLREIHRILKNDGLLVIGVPNFGSIMAGLLGAKWPSLRPEEHIWHFTPATLTQMIAKSGFDEAYFEAKENHPGAGWRPAALLRKIINPLAVLTSRSEAMLLFATKKSASS
jgi:2-polyprenyl-3-methyl-5-hydroxy-6-metoxy-1,4-benzoquinol methylase